MKLIFTSGNFKMCHLFVEILMRAPLQIEIVKGLESYRVEDVHQEDTTRMFETHVYLFKERYNPLFVIFKLLSVTRRHFFNIF